MSRVVEPSDQQLLARVAAGDRTAFTEFYDRHAAAVFGLLTRLLRIRSDAEDVLQETFWQVWRRAADYDPQRASPRVWLTLMARSRAVDRMRRTHREPDELVADAAAPVVDAFDALERSEAMRLARGALASLPAEQSGAIGLAFYGGMTHEQIARLQDVPLGTVKTRIRLGMRRLRQILLEQQTVPA